MTDKCAYNTGEGCGFCEQFDANHTEPVQPPLKWQRVDTSRTHFRALDGETEFLLRFRNTLDHPNHPWHLQVTDTFTGKITKRALYRTRALAEAKAETLREN